MCHPSPIQSKIYKRTDFGDLIAKFLVDTMQGDYKDARFHHRLDAAKQLVRYGFAPTQGAHNDSFRSETQAMPHELHIDPDSLSHEDKSSAAGDERHNPEHTVNPVSYLDILNYDIARQIRRETADGDAIVEFLVKVMNGQQRPFVPKSQRITPANRMAAAKELLRRGFGDFSTTRPHLSESRDDYDTIHENISQRIREHTEYGSDITRFLLEVMAGVLHEDGFTMSHRVSAAQELLHRAYDINFDAVRWKDVEEYWRSQDDFDCAEETHSPLSTWERARVRATPNEGETNTPFPPRGKVRKGATHELLTTEKGEPAPSYPSCTSMSIPAGETKGIHNFAPDESAKDKNNYHFGPADPDPMVDSFYEPLSPEEQAAFDREMRLDTGGLLEDEGASSSRHSHADENPRQGGAGQSSLSCTSMSIPVSENPGGVGEEPAPAKAGGQSSSSCPSMSIPAGTLRRPNIRSP